MLLADLVSTSATVAATRSRTAKVTALADCLRRLGPGEVAAGVGFLTGRLRQGRVGVGWATMRGLARGPASSATLTVAEVDAAIDELARTTGPGSVAARAALLGRLFAEATAPEADFLFRLLGGELRQGALEGLMADAIGRAAEVPLGAVRRAHLLGGDLRDVAVAALEGGTTALGGIGLELGRPLQPMLAATAEDAVAALAATGPASVEWKLDGARLQVHRDGEDAAIFTRSLRDVTSQLPEVVDLARQLPGGRFVLDGEVIGVADDGRPHAFQDTMSRFGTEEAALIGAAGVGDGAAALQPWFFDCLHLGGEDLVDRPLKERRSALAEAAGRLVVPGVETSDPAVAAAFLSGAVESGHEGIVAKSLTSAYDAGRRGGAWRKVKPVHTFDLVVLAAEWGHGRRRGWLSNLHIGARDQAQGGFAMVGKTFKGLTDELLAYQTEVLQAIAVARDGIVVHVRPELVVEVAIDGVQASTRYPGGVTLRFARVRRYRPDKAADEADTIEGLRALLVRRPSSA
ncbi:MAG: ATP-dependent DNA ligase [Acidimicrobiia bacterium]|nr:ATP-dependent DNA ligase [Acidimicrobiia bacterium]